LYFNGICAKPKQSYFNCPAFANIRLLPASLKDDTANMNDRNKHKVTGQMNHRTAAPKAKASVFLFFFHRTFFKNNFRRPHKWHIWFCPTYKPTLRKTKRAIFFATAPVRMLTLRTINN